MNGSLMAGLLDLAARSASRQDRHLRDSDFARRIREVPDSERPGVLRALLARLLDGNQERIADLEYPDPVRERVQREFDRIRVALATEGDDYFDLARHALRCDFRIACFGRVPVGVEHMELGGVPRSLFWRGGLRQAWRFLRMLRQAGGVRPFYEIHMAHGVRPHEFLLVYSRAAQARQFRDLAACLERHPEVRGVMGSSWWFDPQIATVAPYLAYLGDFLLEHGAYRFRYYPVADGGDAIANSPARRKLFEAGKYRPVSHIIVWPRPALLAWAHAHPA